MTFLTIVASCRARGPTMLRLLIHSFQRNSTALSYMTATTMDQSDSISELINEFEATALSLKEKKGGGKAPKLLPSPFQLYQIGKVLYESQEQESHNILLKSYEALLEQLPITYLADVLFHDLNLAFAEAHGTIDAVHSICGLYAETPLACRTGYSVDFCKYICTAYSVLKQEKNHDRERAALLRTLSSLLLESGLFDYGSTQEENQLQSIMEVVQALTEDEHNTCFGDMVEWQERSTPSRALPALVKSRFEETPQREYLLFMLTSSPKSSSAQPIEQPSQRQQDQFTVSSKTVSTADEIQRRIQLVQDVLPELGEGYVETALSCFQGDVDRTVAALLEAQSDTMTLPPILQMMDPKLPRRHTETTPDSYLQNDEEARRITKARLAEMERTQEEEAYALAVVGTNNEYDDDYDDQYDGDDGGELGGGDGETYDVNLDTIRNYNRAAMAAVAEGSFWEENRNLNRAKQQQQTKNDNDGEAKTYRGPDKGKGGRAIGPDGRYLPIKKGGKKGKSKQQQQQQQGNGGGDKHTNAANGQNDKKGVDQQTKIQQKRKNKNKAKVANHHRKERAQKKAAQGM